MTTNNNTMLDWYDCRQAAFFFHMANQIANVTLGLFTNIWVLLIILKDWRKQGAHEIFTVNLAVLETSFCLLLPVAMLSFIWFKSALISKSSWLVYGVCFFGRPLFQCGLCVERYVAVVHPVFFFKHRYLKHKLTFLIVCWIVTFSLSYFDFSRPDVLFPCSVFMVVVTVNGFCSVSILRVLRRPSPGTEGRKVEDTNRMKRRASITVAFVLACLLFNFVPLLVGTVLKPFLTPETLLCVARPLGVSCSVMGCFVQPFIFLHRLGKLKTCAKK